MASTIFSSGTIIASTWLNDVNAAVYSTIPTLTNTTIPGINTTLQTKQDVSAKDTSGGYVGMTGYAYNFWNSTGTYKSQLTNLNTASQTYTFPDKSGTVALLSDMVAVSNSGQSLYLNNVYGGF